MNATPRQLVDTEPARSLVSHNTHLSHRTSQRLTTARGNAIGLTAIVTRCRFNQTTLLEARNRSVQCPRSQDDLSEVFDVLAQGVTVLRTRRETRENQDYRFVVSAQTTCH
jgi:hypothetical protein